MVVLFRPDKDCPTFEFVYSNWLVLSLASRWKGQESGRVADSSGDCWGEMTKLSVYYMGIVVTIIINIGLPSPIIICACISGNKWTDGWLDLDYVGGGGREGNDCGRSIQNPFDVNVRSINRTFRSEPLTCLASFY